MPQMAVGGWCYNGFLSGMRKSLYPKYLRTGFPFDGIGNIGLFMRQPIREVTPPVAEGV